MHPQTHRAARVGALAGLFALTVFLYARPCPSNALPPPSAAGFTAQQIIERTKRLCWTVAPEAGRVTMSADRSELEASGGRPVRSWTVECADLAGNLLACFVWNADSGELMSASRSKSAHPRNMTGRMGRQEAVRTAKQWMRSLSISPLATSWRLRTEPVRRGNAWHIPWQAGDRRATIAFNARTGSLNLALCWRARRV